VGELSSLTVKEVKDTLRDPHIVVSVIIMPLIIFALMGQVAGWGARQVSESAAPKALRLGVIDLDHGAYSHMLYDYLSNRTKSTKLLSSVALKNPANALGEGLDAVLVISNGFSENISHGVPAVVFIYSIVKELGFASTAKLSSIEGLINGFAGVVRSSVALRLGVNPGFVDQPVSTVMRVWTGSQYLSLMKLQMLSAMVFVFAFTPMIAIGLAAQMAAMSMGVEKEEKTLETLLSLPLSRRSIALSKLLGSLVIGLLATISYMIGFAYYMYMLSSGRGGFGRAGGLVEVYLSPWRAAWLLISFLTAVMLANTLAAVLGALGSNVKSSQSLASIIWMLLFAVGFGILYMSFDALSPISKILVASIPLGLPYIVAKDLSGAYLGYATLSLILHGAYIAVAFEALTRVLGSEILLSNKGLSSIIRSKMRSMLGRRQEPSRSVPA